VEKEETHFIKMSDLMLANYQTLENNYSEEKELSGLPTGFIQLDKLTLGLQRNDLIVVAGRSCAGKTIFLVNIARHLAVKAEEEAAIVIFSLEKSAEDFSMAMLSCETGIKMSNLRKGQLKPKDWRDLASATGRLAEANVTIDDTSLISVDDLYSRCVQLKETDKLDIVMIDSLQLIKPSKFYEDAHQEIAEKLSGLKSLARELKVPVVISSRINDHDYYDARRPLLEDLPGSCAIDQYADLILFIRRPRTAEWDGLAEISVAKQRNGPEGAVRLHFFGDTNRFNTIYDDSYFYD